MLIAIPLRAQFDNDDKSWSVEGTFYVSADAAAHIFVNGKKLFGAGIMGGESPVITLHPDDRLVAKLTNIPGTPRHFALMFVSTDKKLIISFRAVAFKLMPDPKTEDFAVTDFMGFHGIQPFRGKDGGHLRTNDSMPYKNDCDLFWGDRDQCAVGTIISGDMFSPMIPQ